jgi:hypothetical protein
MGYHRTHRPVYGALRRPSGREIAMTHVVSSAASGLAVVWAFQFAPIASRPARSARLRSIWQLPAPIGPAEPKRERSGSK